MLDDKIFQKIHLETFISLDTETTGFDPLQDDIIEFAAVKYEKGEPVDEISFLIQPRKTVPEEITRITGISNDMVKDAPRYEDFHKEIRDFLADYPVVAHNIDFDINMLEAHYQRSGSDPPENQLYDSLILARTFAWWLVDHKLKTVARAFGVERSNEHRALADAKMAGDSFLKLVGMMVATPLETIRQCNHLLSDVDVHTKQLFVDVANLLISRNEPEGIGEPPLKPPKRFNIYGEGGLEFDGMGEPLESIDTFELTRYFTKDGALGQSLSKFEERDAQAAMAEAVANSLNDGTFLVAEAGTGVGKSLAYTLPGILWALKNNDRGERLVISSNTKNLQEQLFYKDIPFIHDRLGLEFKAVLLKGRSNYLCKNKWADFFRNVSRFAKRERVGALPIVIWASQTETGDISENNGFHEGRNANLWNKVASESGYCTTKRCQKFNGCFLGPLKKHATNAHLVLVNHSLLLADAASGHMAIPEYHHLVVDEAHNLENSAYRYFASEFDIWKIRNATGTLYTKSRAEYGILATLRVAVTQMDEEKETGGLESQIDASIEGLSALEKAADAFLSDFHTQAARNQRQFTYTERVRYTSESRPFDSLGKQIQVVRNSFKEVMGVLKELHQHLKDFSDDYITDVDQIRQDIQYSYDELIEIAHTFHAITEAADPEQIYWYELPVSEKGQPKFITTPISVGEVLTMHMYDELRTAVFTSATLKVADSFKYFKSRTGLDTLEEREVVTADFGSPYYLSEQIIGCVTSYVERPGSEEHSKQLAEIVRNITERYQRGTLVLTTSYRNMDQIFSGIESYYREMEIGLLRQTRNISRTDLIEQFRDEQSSVLIGTESFWEGVDVPGEALQVLLIGKLPFSVPTDPVVEANTAAIEEAGGNGFIDYTLPEAIIQFRQGFGRLIRSSTDSGVVIIADPRVATKQYGRYIADSLPIDLEICQTQDALFDMLDNWFRRN
ncbi:MAG: DEAD/DEAH box helicase family protein [Candidatus Marinimicrobia bacterium]|nr:DEAD/DEAH box helicase family protein [Candidatus Neomarinimicrobiota bacterium]MCF7828092.1 DEAD/DEAH box helicase family protein [Candidatus Neomarinimicrobiota bacterium]MCF7879733.1 DEAD/DEAH box helicase family protein [Candidatus Neomarinimicrobiota bacterium]